MRKSRRLWIGFQPTSLPEAVIRFRADRLGKWEDLANSAKGPRKVRGDSAPEPLRQAGGKIQAIAIHQLMPHFNLGGGKWVSNLIF